MQSYQIRSSIKVQKMFFYILQADAFRTRAWWSFLQKWFNGFQPFYYYYCYFNYYFYKKLHHRCQTGFWIRLCTIGELTLLSGIDIWVHLFFIPFWSVSENTVKVSRRSSSFHLSLYYFFGLYITNWTRILEYLGMGVLI